MGGGLKPYTQPCHLAPWGGGEGRGGLADQGLPLLRRKKLREERVGAGAHLGVRPHCRVMVGPIDAD